MQKPTDIKDWNLWDVKTSRQRTPFSKTKTAVTKPGFPKHCCVLTGSPMRQLSLGNFRQRKNQSKNWSKLNLFFF